MEPTPDLAAVFARHEKVALAFSGGKDSLAVLQMCRPFRDKLAVLWVNPGAMFPHMREFVHEATEGFNFVELASDLAGWIKNFGLPADIVPVANSVWGHDPGRPATMLQPWSACCAKLRFQPILDYLATFGVSLFVHGQRLSDRGGFNAVSGPDAEVEICAPLREWSERDVFDYIERHGVELPEQCSMGIRDSLECSNCPARADGSADSQEALFEYMAQR